MEQMEDPVNVAHGPSVYPRLRNLKESLQERYSVSSKRSIGKDCKFYHREYLKVVDMLHLAVESHQRKLVFTPEIYTAISPAFDENTLLFGSALANFCKENDLICVEFRPEPIMVNDNNDKGASLADICAGRHTLALRKVCLQRPSTYEVSGWAPPEEQNTEPMMKDDIPPVEEIDHDTSILPI